MVSDGDDSFNMLNDQYCTDLPVSMWKWKNVGFNLLVYFPNLFLFLKNLAQPALILVVF